MGLRIAGLLAAAFVVLALAAPAQAKCGNVSISEMNWDSAAVAAHVEAMILAKGYGCQVDLVPGDTVPTLTSMTEKGEPDIAPEIWINSVKEVMDKAVKEGRLKIAGEILSDGGEEGWWVPEYVVKANPELTTLDAVKKRPDLFADKEDPGKGRFYGCPSGWACQIINANLFKAYGLKEAKFNLFDPGSGPGLAGAIAKAYERKQAIFTYYWAPTSVLGKYPMVKLGGMNHDPKTYACVTDKDCADPKPNMYPKSVVLTAVVGQVRGEGAGGVQVRVERVLAQLAVEQAAGVEGRPEGGCKGDRGALHQEQRGGVVEVGVRGRGGEGQGRHVGAKRALRRES